MKPTPAWTAALAFAAAASAQCVPPVGTQSLVTTFAGTTYLGTVDATFGSNVYFDLSCNTTITVQSLAINLLDDGLNVVSPNLVGQTADLAVFGVMTSPSSYVGQTAPGLGGATAFPPSPANWTLLSMGAVTVRPGDEPSPVALAQPIVLAPGSYAIALNHLFVRAGQPDAGAPIHPLYTNPAILPTPTAIGDQFVTLGLGAAQSAAWTGGLASPRIANVRIDYTVGGGVAYSSPYGVGCYDRKQSFYESWAAPGAPLVANLDVDPVGSGGAQNGFDLFFLGDRYLAVGNAATGLVVTPGSSVGARRLNASAPSLSSSALQPWDDATSGPIALPFPLPYPGNPAGTNVIDVGSNGIVRFAAATSTLGFYGDFGGFLAGPPGIAAAWCDFEPADLLTSLGGAGDVWYDTDGIGYVAVTWSGVQAWNEPTNLSTAQLVLRSNGDAQIRYGAAGVRFSSSPVLVGFTPGDGAADPGEGPAPRQAPDLSVVMAGGGFVSGDDASPAALRVVNRPIVGNALVLATTGSDPSCVLNATWISSGSLPGLDLGFVGMPGCSAYLSLPGLASSLVPLVGGAASWTATPSIPSTLAGLDLFAQSVQVATGVPVSYNPANLLVANAVCIHFDHQ